MLYLSKIEQSVTRRILRIDGWNDEEDAVIPSPSFPDVPSMTSNDDHPPAHFTFNPVLLWFGTASAGYFTVLTSDKR